ncbi:glutathione synthase [Ectothiorhodospiraceae bacterium WFHF3C12]|nr:glutathione synthase [Ectothiorhodospiraceae bacterium WFHF3C12]
MPVKLGVVMDPIESIKPYKDTTFAMLLEAQRRGWDIHYMTLADIALHGGEAWGRSRPLQLRDNNDDYFTAGEAREYPLSSLDIVLMRKDPPVDSEYVYATHILEAAERGGTMVCNKPSGLRDAQEKLFTAHFPDCCAPTLVSMEADAIKAFIHEHGKAVLKPLYGMGGEAVFVVQAGDPNTSVIIETLSHRGARYVMAQRYLPEIKDGDKRILVIDGEPVPYALARIPAVGETRGNIAAGGRGEGMPLTDRDRWICEQVAPALRERGLGFVGLDVIGEYLTEVNVTSPTCIRELDGIYGINISGTYFDYLERSLDARR